MLGQEDTSWNNMKKFLGAKAVKDEVWVVAVLLLNAGTTPPF